MVILKFPPAQQRKFVSEAEHVPEFVFPQSYPGTRTAPRYRSIASLLVHLVEHRLAGKETAQIVSDVHVVPPPQPVWDRSRMRRDQHISQRPKGRIRR